MVDERRVRPRSLYSKVRPVNVVRRSLIQTYALAVLLKLFRDFESIDPLERPDLANSLRFFSKRFYGDLGGVRSAAKEAYDLGLEA